MNWCIKDSDSFQQEVTNLVLPPNARVATLDAKAMCNNINIPHALKVMGKWIDRYLGVGIARKVLPWVLPAQYSSQTYILLAGMNKKLSSLSTRIILGGCSITE
eukprot:scaffold30255_cov52-Cyclotella_meneghiniana.AAC.3